MQVVTGKEMGAVDRYAIGELGMPGAMLMENAGRAVATRLLHHYHADEHFLVLIGSGNNGGDGFVVARALKDAERTVNVCVIPPEEKFTGDARRHKQLYENVGYTWSSYDPVYFHKNDVIVDALLGTGIAGEIRKPYREIIQTMNDASKTVVAVDLPSGVPGDESPVPDGALKADRTITLQQPKLSHYTYPARDYYGQTEVAPIGIPPLALEKTVETRRSVWKVADVITHWQPRAASSHKGSHGKVGIIAGSERMPGAAALTAGAAVKSGAGLTTVNTTETAIAAVSARVPEATYFHRESDIESFYENKDAIAIGPGVGVNEKGRDTLATLVDHYQGPIIVDADGIHQLGDMLENVRAREHPLIITPHPGEMAALVGSSPNEINSHRFEIAESFAREYGIYVVLKGPCTLVATPNGDTWINATGNAGLAKGGSGDVLTGMILAFIARTADIQPAISTAVHLHGYTADYLLKQGTPMETMTAADIVQALPASISTLEGASTS
ncbi:NAD(P)H-hydrate dehydratase [Natribacillus halophilus]|uniref:Bifunctional NAD(P)H-hydrate repair enzyme n=1 Tax=Natribacillus halophilus TaxID=549003 RepID=A0A1G8N3Y3_9BACI|nr:NAD(P)H-hydrate dehydratase [Natribacillus halophilus]SDI74902.1 NAD(P)H-hydrate epimerase [Natribacillus halophilus]